MTQPTADVCERWNAGGTVRRPPMTTANAVNASVSVDAGADCAAHQPTGSSRLATQRYANDSHTSPGRASTGSSTVASQCGPIAARTSPSPGARGPTTIVPASRRTDKVAGVPGGSMGITGMRNEMGRSSSPDERVRIANRSAPPLSATVSCRVESPSRTSSRPRRSRTGGPMTTEAVNATLSCS
jgi:hypothetical protein